MHRLFDISLPHLVRSKLPFKDAGDRLAGMMSFCEFVWLTSTAPRPKVVDVDGRNGATDVWHWLLLPDSTACVPKGVNTTDAVS